MVDNRQGVRRVLMVALGLNISMSLLKLLVGAMSGSLAVIADGMHSATDALSSLTGLVTNKLSIHARQGSPLRPPQIRGGGSPGYRWFHPVHSHRDPAAFGERLLRACHPSG